MSRQGLLKHLLNEQMNTRMETVDAYMQIIPPGSRSGKHRHLAEECLYVVEGYGYDLHQDCDVEITDKYTWKPQDEIKRFEWEAGDVIYIPPSTIHQHFNADPEQPARLISCTNRIYKNPASTISRRSRTRPNTIPTSCSRPSWCGRISRAAGRKLPDRRAMRG